MKGEESAASWRSKLILVAALGLPTVAHAAAVDQLRSFLTQTQSARGDFTQRVTARAGSKPQESSGTFAFQRPGKFRWVYGKPYQQTLVADGDRLFIYDKDLNQVTVRKLTGALPASPASILFGSNDFERDFVVEDGGSRDGLQWIVARPRAKDTVFDRVEIGFRDSLPAAMALTDSFGQTSILVFGKVERNPPLAADTFRFVAPAGADVLQE
ncbi:MAG: outer membrane lipoprotein chaperone LolA [Betaproteobacteria bacterium]